MKKQKIKITTDSSSDFFPLAKEFDVEVIPQVIILGDTEYFDGVNIDSDAVYEYVAKTKKLPTTAAISGTYIEDVFKKLSKEHEAVIHISISSTLSSSINVAKKAAEGLGNVHVVDSLCTSGAQALLVLRAAELARQGKSVDEIVRAVEGLRSKINLTFMLETLEFLHKGGRVSGLKKAIATLLKIRPLLGLAGGKIVPLAKRYKGKYNIVLEKFINERFAESANVDKEVCIILNGRAPAEFVKMAEEKAKEAGFKTVHSMPLGANMTCHSGAGTLVIVFLNK